MDCCHTREEIDREVLDGGWVVLNNVFRRALHDSRLDPFLHLNLFPPYIDMVGRFDADFNLTPFMAENYYFDIVANQD